MTDHKEIIRLVRETARAGDEYWRARKALARALGIDGNLPAEDNPRLVEVITLTNPDDETDVQESADVLIAEVASGEIKKNA